jgi:hypothetical protein
MKVIENFEISRKNKYALIRLTVQELWSLQVGGWVLKANSGQIKLSKQIWTLKPFLKEI